MLRKVFLILSVMIILPNITIAEDPYQILDKYNEVVKAKLSKDSIKTLKFTAINNASNPMTGQSASITLKFWFKRDSMFRFEQEANGQKAIIGFDGTTLWGPSQSNPNKYEVAPSSARDQVIAQLLNENILLEEFLDYNKDSLKLEYVEKVSLDEKELHKIKFVKYAELDNVNFYFDALTSLLYQVDFSLPQGLQVIKIKQYTKSGGFFFPLKVETWFKDKKISDKTYQAITVNPKVDDRFFAIPEEK